LAVLQFWSRYTTI